MCKIDETTFVDDLDEQDIGLKKILGDRYIDATEIKPMSEEQPTAAKAEQNHKPKHLSNEPTFMAKLIECVKYAVPFGGLTVLVSYWEQAALMDESIAVPCMCVCAALAGWGVGKSFAKGERR